MRTAYAGRRPALCLAVLPLVAVLLGTGSAFAAGQFTTFPSSGFTQELWVVGNTYPDYLVGIAFDPSNGLWTTTSAADHSLRHWSTTPQAVTHGSANVHPLSSTVVVPGVTRILGLTNHSNHSMYGIAQEGIVELSETTGAKISGPWLPAGVPAGKITITVDPVTNSSGNQNVVAAFRWAAGGDDPRTAIYSMDPVAKTFTLMYTAPDADDVDGICFDPTGQYFFYAVPFPLGSSSIVVLKRTGVTLTFAQRISTSGAGPDGLIFNDCGGFLMSNDAAGTLTRYDFPNGYALAPTITTLASGGFRGDLLGISPIDHNAYVTQWAPNAPSSGTRYDDGTTLNNPSIVQVGPCFAWLPLTPTATHVDACYGEATGSINLTVGGGTMPYTYSWSPGGATTQDLSGLLPGSYTVTVTDATSATATLTVTIGQFPQLFASTTATDVRCFGGSTGSVDLTVSGGKPPYTYLWSPGGATTQDLVNVVAANYSVTVTDANGCSVIRSATVNQPAAALQASAVATPVACAGGSTGSIDLTVSGGTPLYTYLWNTNATTEDLSGVPAGTYSVTVTDANGCTAGVGAELIVGLPAPLQTSFAKRNASCFGGADGAIDLTVTGGAAPYTYLWSPNGATTQDLGELTAGTYAVTVTDANGCTGTGSTIVGQPSAIQPSFLVTDVACYGAATGAIDLTVTGGTGPYSYLWSPSNDVTQDLTGLTAGAYSVTVTDANGCTATASATVHQPLTPLVASVSVIPVSTQGGSDGSVNLTVSGGWFPYTFSWAPGGATTEDRSGLAAGTYTVTITDAHGCITHVTAIVLEALVSIAGADLLHDAFPFSNDSTHVAFSAFFDTTSALIKTGRNTALLTGNDHRLDIPGDTLVVCSCGNNVRIDFVFRILPGPGNYHVAGNRTSGLRPVPTDNVNVVASGSANFWGQYLANNGTFGTPGGHSASTWNPNVWNSARMDTAETNLYPIASRGDLPQLNPCAWASMYHESDPKFATLGIVKNRCFLTTPTAPLTQANIVCNISQTNGWPVTAGYVAENGLPLGRTYEYTKILPDGQFTPGTHVEYFIRRSLLPSPGTFAMTPDTNRVTPQAGEIQGANSDCSPTNGTANTDGHRWEQFGVLPDKWKSPTYGGLGMACMLYVDLDDGFGDERAWVTAADLLGATAPARWGAHNGWHVSSLTADPNDPANFVRVHKGQAGSTWDMYQVRGVSDPIHGHAGSLGSRVSWPAVPASPASGKEARIGPTATMLRTFYRVLFVTSGRFASGLLGPFADRSQDDMSMLMAYRSGSLGGNPRGLWVEGASFAQAEDINTTAGYTQHNPTIGALLGGNLDVPAYPASNPSPCVDVVTTAASHPSSPGVSFGVDNTQLPSNDVLLLVSSGIVANYFQTPPGPQSIASTMIRPFGTTYWTGLLDAWDIQDLNSKSCPAAGTGRLSYTFDVLSFVFGPLCPLTTTDVGEAPAAALRSSLSLLSNPVRFGPSHIQLTLARADHVELTVLDVAGRRVRSLWNGRGEAGVHDIVWDGSDERGQMSRPGVYFVRARIGSESSVFTRTLVRLR